MPYIPYTDEQKLLANSVDLFEFLRMRGETLERAGREYKLIYHDESGKHDSITISGSQWYDHKNQIGGGPIKFMQEHYGMGFQEAMQALLGHSALPLTYEVQPVMAKEKKEFKLPEANDNMHRVYAYLIKQRFIAPEVITHFAKRKLLYEDKKHHNAVFVGVDGNGVPRQAHKRSTTTFGNSFRQTIEGSDTKYSFAHFGISQKLFVFEAPIDLMSFLTLYPKDWKQHSYIAMNGVYESAVLTALVEHPNLTEIVICTDNDEGGIDAADRLTDVLKEHGYAAIQRLEPTMKDWNEVLKVQHGAEALPAVPHRRIEMFTQQVDCLQYLKLRPEKLNAQLYTTFRNGQYKYLAEYALAGSAYFIGGSEDIFRKLKTKLTDEYRAYSDKGRMASKIELRATTEDKLRELQADIQMELTRSKISVDRLLLRQKEGFLAVLPCGNNVFASQFERVLPASSVANLYPLNYSGKTDQHGFYIGRDKYGSNVLVDFDKRSEDKTNSNVLILGNSGQGKSHLLKLLLCNHREAGKSVLVLDPESEYQELCANLGGTYIDMMSGEYMINPLEPKAWGEAEKNIDAPEVFRKVTRLSQHISYLKDFFRAYKDFTDAEIDTIEIMLMKLYGRFGMDDGTDFDRFDAEDYPTMSDLYELTEKEFMAFDSEKKHLYTEEMLQNICLGLHSMCKGAEAKYFDGHTNIKDAEFICFGVKGLMDTNKRLKDTLLFNILSYMSNQLLGKGNTVAAVDELYLFLTNMTAIEYIRNGMKRVRKKESSFILASQNIEDFLLPEIKEFTKPLFSIPSHHFLFNAGQINPQEYMDALQLEESEFSLIRYPERGTCLYRCGNERYLLQVIAPSYKAALFGAAGGR